MRDGFRELPRVPAASLTYARFLREFALPRQPFILTGVGEGWPANAWTPERLLAHPGVELAQPVTATVSGLAADGVERETTVGEALRELQARRAGGARPGGGAYYLSAWNYVRGGSGALQADFTVPPCFDRAPRWLAEHAVLGSAAQDMRWLYIGEAGSGSASHVDTNLSSAWLWVAEGEKEWVCAHGADHDLVAGRSAAEMRHHEAPPLPDLFADDVLEAHPRLRRARLFHGFQRKGEVCFNPSACVHAVRNRTFTLSLTHNYIDATNLADAVRDATHSLRSELLPMVGSLGGRSVLKTLQATLGVKRKALERTLRQLPELLSAEAVADVVRAACEPEADAAARAEVQALLEAHLGGALDARLRDDFGAASRELRRALRLEPEEPAS